MVDRDNLILSIRSEIPNIKVDCKSELESFQNKTLRPILKLQNDLTLLLLKSSKGYNLVHDQFDEPGKFKTKLDLYLSKNLNLKSGIVSFITALFTQDEYSFYISNRKEINKRILSMQAKRFLDNLIPVK